MSTEHNVNLEFDADFKTTMLIPFFDWEIKEENLTVDGLKASMSDAVARDRLIAKLRSREISIGESDEALALQILDSAIASVESHNAKVVSVETINFDGDEIGALSFGSVEQMIEQTDCFEGFTEVIAKCNIPSDQLETYLDSFKAFAKRFEVEHGDPRKMNPLTPEQEEEVRAKQKAQKMMTEALKPQCGLPSSQA